MMADSCDAAVRSLSDNSPSVVRNLIHKIIWDKVMDGQLSECSLTLKDLDLIEEAFFQVLSGMHHQRIEYPAALDQKDEETEGDTGEKLALESGKKKIKVRWRAKMITEISNFQNEIEVSDELIWSIRMSVKQTLMSVAEKTGLRG